jgi:anti-sigma regulatory factor (Ser/Thr protein kinase)
MHARHVPVCSFALPAEPASVRRARRWMLAFAQEHSSDCDLHERVALAFTEAFTNAVRHAYPNAAPGWDDIQVSADVDDGTLEIVVIDHGAGFEAASRASGLGVGLGIVASCADHFAIRERTTRGTEVWMAFRLADA